MSRSNDEAISTFQKKKKSAYTSVSASDDIEFAGNIDDGEVIVHGELVPSFQDVTGCRRKHLLFAGLVCFIIVVNLTIVAMTRDGARSSETVPVMPLQDPVVEDGDDGTPMYDFTSKNHDSSTSSQYDSDEKVESTEHVAEVDDAVEPEDEVEEVEPEEVETVTETETETEVNEENKSPEQVEEGKDHHEEKKSWWSSLTSWFTGDDDRPTKLPGGGRDWLVNAKEGTVSPKHDPSFYLGSGPNTLKLVSTDSKDKVFFSKENDENDEWMKLSISRSSQDTAWYVGKYPNADVIPLKGVKFYPTIASSWSEPLLVKYVDDNYIATKDDFVLDIAQWNIVEGSDINFIQMDDGSSYTSGGGRDWTWNEDGSLSPTLNPELAIGLSPAGLVITKEKDQAIQLKHAQDLANGKTVPFQLIGNDLSDAVGFADEGTYDRWHYRTSVLFLQSENNDDSSDVASIKYDGNFLLTDDESYALDIAFWKMESWNSVNFVGGDDD